MRSGLLIIFILLLGFTGDIMADGKENIGHNQETSAITGKVTDKISGEELVCANITIEDKNLTIRTDIEGKFQIDDIEPGNYTLKITYISYKETLLKNVRVKKNKSNELEILLEPISF